MPKHHRRNVALHFSVAAVSLCGVVGAARAQDEMPADMAARLAAAKAAASSNDKDELPPFEKVSEGFEKVISTADGQKSLWTVWTREKDGQMLAELPRNFERQRLFFAMTIAGGIPTAGIQFGDMYVSWKRYGDRLALIEPNLATRSTGDSESQRSRDQLFTDRVVLDVPIVAKGPGGGVVIDLDDLLVGKARNFFGGAATGINARLARIATAKAFPENIEIAFEAPVAGNNNRLTTFHYSISVLPERTGYKPRKADPRVGYFTTAYSDLANVPEEDLYTRYVNRWHLEKADPKLSMSPPKEPIVFYIEHTTPIRYRRYVREGILEWNKAFEKIGIIGAIEVYQQDATTGAHMDKDPEDRRYNFHRWNSNAAGFAIGPSRVDPRTGQILDADVVMNDGWLRFAAAQWQRVIPQTAIENFGPETLAWLNERPHLDPRIRLLPASERDDAIRERRRAVASGKIGHRGGHPAANVDATLVGDDMYDGLAHRISQMNGYCSHVMERGLDLAAVRTGLLPIFNDEGGSDDILDGAPEWFVGAMIKDVVMHEIGHTLGLRHNFKASSIYDMETINTENRKGEAFTGSVMDYNALNIQYGELGEEQADYFMPTIGPYDYWVIEYGYALEDKKLPEILSRVSEDELPYATDEDTWGPDPLARRRDMGANPLDFDASQMELVKDLRKELIERVMEDGDSWAKVRSAYGTTLGIQMRAVSNAANWLGGSYVHRDRKGDPGDRDPVVPVEVEHQRRALDFVIDNSFRDEAYGLTAELLSKMTIDKWWDAGGFSQIFTDPTFEIHDTIIGIQASAMTMLMNPTTLRRVYDLEFRVSSDEDYITLPEIMNKVTDSVWSELGSRADKRYTARKPMISSLRRNLQREHLDRLIDLTLPQGLTGAASRPMKTLATHHLRELHKQITSALERADSKIDDYSLAHLSESSIRIEKALDAQYIYNAQDIGGGGSTTIILQGQPDGR